MWPGPGAAHGGGGVAFGLWTVEVAGSNSLLAQSPSFGNRLNTFPPRSARVGVTAALVTWEALLFSTTYSARTLQWPVFLTFYRKTVGYWNVDKSIVKNAFLTHFKISKKIQTKILGGYLKNVYPFKKVSHRKYNLCGRYTKSFWKAGNLYFFTPAIKIV